VAGLARPNPAQPLWVELGPAQKNNKNKKIKSVEIKILHVLENIIFINLFTDIRIWNNIYIYTFFLATNFYQRQSWNYSWWKFY
jgi:hypothetical protein